MEKIPLWDLRNMLTELKTNHSLDISNETYFEENFKLLEAGICPEDQKTEYVNAPSEFFKNYAMNMTSTIDETGQVQMHLVYALIFAWFICYFTIIKGVKSSGKVVWFTAIFPYIVLLILVIRGCTLEGADKGIQYYIGKESNFSKVNYHISRFHDSNKSQFSSQTLQYGGRQQLKSFFRCLLGWAVWEHCLLTTDSTITAVQILS